MNRSFLRVALRFIPLALGLALAPLAAAPSHLLITAPVGAPGTAALPGLLAEWRQKGLVSDAFLLRTDLRTEPAFALLAVLEFPDDLCRARWREAGQPALGGGVVATEVEQLARGETFPRDSTKAVFVVHDAAIGGPSDAYARQARASLAPELEALRSRKILTSYYLFAPSGGGHSTLILEYREPVAYAQRTPLQHEGVAGSARETSALWDLLPAPALADLPSYRPEYHVTGTIRVLGSFLKFATEALEQAFLHYQPDAQFANNFSTSSEGAIGGLATGISDLAPAGDDGKITEMMPFYNVTGYVPTELSVATGDYEKRGALWPAAIVVNVDNPIAHVSMDELDRIFGSERTGGWEVGNNADHDIYYTSEFARGPETNLRRWGQLGLTGEWADREIQTYGYCAPGFKIYWERKLFHWSTKYNPNFREYVEPKQAEPGPAGKAVAVDSMLESLSQDRYGIGWVAMFHAKNYPRLKVLAVAARPGGPWVPYTPETVSNRTYPLSRDAFFYVNREPGHPLDPKVREFLRFILSREGQQVIAHTGFFYPLTADYLREQLGKVE